MSESPDICMVYNCNEPVKVLRGGLKSRYCRTHHRARGTSNRRRGLAPMTENMLAVLRHLRDLKAQEITYAALRGVDRRTLETLCERDWIMPTSERLSAKLGGICYSITGRGEKALNVYEPRLKRDDGLCPM